MLIHSERLRELAIDANSILSSLHLAVEPYTVYLSGSIIEGHGNADSDLDVFVIYTEDTLPTIRTDFQLDQALITLEYTEKWRLDIESWSKSEVLSIAENFNRVLAASRKESLTIAPGDFSFAHKLHTAIPILHPDNFQQLYNTFDFVGISHLIMYRNLAWYDGMQEDAAGSITSRHYGTALLTARLAVQFAIDAWIAFHGETNTSDKWRFVKLEKLNDAALLERYWQVEAPGIKNREDALIYAKNCLNFANQLIMKLQKAKE